jgi:hypothetical protein
VDTRKLIDEMKAERARVPRELLDHFEEKGVRFIWTIVTGDDTWVHHYDPENKISVYGILPQRITSTKEIQNQSLS